jgi:hypothetical protein
MKRKPGKILNGIAFGQYNKKIDNPKTPFDWVTSDEAEVEKSLAYIRLQLKALIARDIWDMSEYFSVINERSEIVKKALEIMEK